MKWLDISPDLVLPTDTVTSTLIVYGGKGMGKTNFGSVLVEELTRAGLRWSVLDPLGVWWGLRHSADGKGSGIECLVLGGSHADIPIEPTGGAIVADLVVDETANVVIDFSRKPSGEMWSVGERIRFVTDYAYRLFQRQGELVNGERREPIFQVLDESARYVPQIIPSGAIDLAKCVNAWEQIVEEGRNIGIGVCLLTQRSARMNKSVSELADAVLAFRIVGPNSIDAITDWLGEHVPKPEVKAMVEKIRSLERGRCLVVSPGWLKFEGVIGIRQRNTFDSSATPKPGERARRVHGEGAKPNLAKYVERMKATIEKAKADDPKELRKRIKELEAEAAKPVAAAPWRETIDRKQMLEAERKEIERITHDAIIPQVVKLLRGIYGPIEKSAESLQRSSKFMLEQIEALANKPATLRCLTEHFVKDAEAAITVESDPVKPDPARKPVIQHSKPSGSGDSSLSPGEKQILTAVVQMGGVTGDQLGVLTGYKSTSRYEYTRKLTVKGYVTHVNGPIEATQAGVDALGSDYEPLPTGRALYEWWMARLGGAESAILRHLVVTRRGHATSPEELESVANIKSTSRYEYVRKLKARRLVTSEGKMVKASESLFEARNGMAGSG
jgi:hypothetical protein